MAKNDITSVSTSGHPERYSVADALRATVRLLEFAVAQIDFTLNESESSADALTDCFTAVASEAVVLDNILRTCQEGDLGVQRQAMVAYCAGISKSVTDGTVALQFYDQLVQRLAQVRQGLASLSDLLQDPSRVYSPEEWSRLEHMLAARASSEQDKVLLDALRAGATPRDALNRVASGAGDGHKNSAELF